MKRGPTGPPAGRRGPLSLKSRFLTVLGLRSFPDGSGQAVGFIWPLFRAKPSILDPFRTKFDVFGPDRNFGQPGFGLGLALDKPHCCWKAQPLSETSTSVLSQQKTVKKHRVFVCLSSRPGVSCERGEGQCHQVSIFTTTSRPQAPQVDPGAPP